MSTVAERVRRLREERGETQFSLATRAGVTPSTIARLESGKYQPRVGTLTRLAEALDVSLAALIGDAA